MNTVKHRKLLILIVFVSVVGGAYVSLQSVVELYEVKAQLLVKLGRENLEAPVSVERGSVLSAGVRREEINSYVHLLSADELVEQTLDTIGLAAFRVTVPEPRTALQRFKRAIKDVVKAAFGEIDEFLITINLKKKLSEREKLLAFLGANLRVYGEKEADVIGVSLRFPDPELAERIVRTLINIYLERHVAVRRQADIQDLFVDQMNLHQDQLTKLEQSRETLRAQLNLSSIDGERKVLLSRRGDLARSLDAVEREQAMVPPVDADVLRDHAMSLPPYERLKAQIANLRLQREQKLQSYDPATQLVMDINAQIKTMEGLAAASLQTQRMKLRKQINRIDQRLGQLNDAEAELARIERERSITEQRYIAYAKRQEDARIASELDRHRVANVTVLAAPTRPLEPVYPRKLLVMVLALFMGLLLGVGFAVLVEYLSGMVRTPRDLEGIQGLTYLGSFRQPGTA